MATKKLTKSGLLQLPNLQKTHKWTIEFIRRPVISGIIDNSTIAGIVKSADTPKYQVETGEFNVHGLKWEEPVNVLTNGEWQFTAFELENAIIRNLCTAWNNALLSGTLSRKDGTGDIKLTSTTAAGKANQIYIIKNWYPTDVQVPEFASDAALMETTIAGKYMDLEIRRA